MLTRPPSKDIAHQPRRASLCRVARWKLVLAISVSIGQPRMYFLLQCHYFDEYDCKTSWLPHGYWHPVQGFKAKSGIGTPSRRLFGWRIDFDVRAFPRWWFYVRWRLLMSDIGADLRAAFAFEIVGTSYRNDFDWPPYSRRYIVFILWLWQYGIIASALRR